MNTGRRITVNFLFLSTANIISKGLVFITVIYLARILGPENFGKLIFAQAFIVYFMLVTNMGLSTLGIREIVRNKDKINDYINNIFALRLVLSGISFCLLLVFVSLIRKPVEIKYLIVVYGLSLFPFALLFEWVFEGLEQMKYVGMSRVLDKLCFFLLIFLFVQDSKGLLIIPWFGLAGSFFATMFLIYIYIKKIGKIKIKVNVLLWKNLIKQALPMGTAYILVQLPLYFDTIILGFMKTNEMVGWYNAAYKIVLFFGGFSGILGIAIFPVITRFYKESLEKLKIFIYYINKMAILVTIPTAIAGTIFAGPMMNLFYGNQYNNGIIAFQILIWSIIFGLFNIPFALLLITADKQKKYMRVALTGAIVNISLNLFLIPKYSLIGAGTATIISEIVMFVMLYFYVCQIIQISIKTSIFKSLIASIPMGLCMCFLNQPVLVRLVGGGIVYILFLFWSKEIRKEDIIFFKLNFTKGNFE
jgi:O-antigen/teichoic acid export membrane protein